MACLGYEADVRLKVWEQGSEGVCFPPTHECGTCRRANRLNVVIVQCDPSLCDVVNIWGRNLSAPVEADIVESQIVRDDEDDVWRRS